MSEYDIIESKLTKLANELCELKEGLEPFPRGSFGAMITDILLDIYDRKDLGHIAKRESNADVVEFYWNTLYNTLQENTFSYYEETGLRLIEFFVYELMRKYTVD